MSFSILKHRTEHDAGSLVNIPDGARGMTPLHFACSDNNKELVALLLEAGADPGLRYDTIMAHVESEIRL